MSENKFVGVWHIYEMEQWEEDYCNMEVQAYIEVKPDFTGKFQFGLVSGWMDCELDDERLEFTWVGNEECDEAQGSGWLKLKDEKTLQGKIKFHEGDSSLLMARRVEG